MSLDDKINKQFFVLHSTFAIFAIFFLTDYGIKTLGKDRTS